MKLQLKRKLFRSKQQKIKIFVDNFMPPAFEFSYLLLVKASKIQLLQPCNSSSYVK